MNISNTQFNELKSIAKDFNQQKRKINKEYLDNIINDIKSQKEKDLVIVDKLKKCLIHRYDTIINYFELLKEELFKLKNIIKKKYIKFKKEYYSEKFDPDILLNSIREVNDKLSIIDCKFEPFLIYKENDNCSYSYRIINFSKIIEEKKIHYLVSPIKSIFFHDFNIVVYPFGLDGDSSYFEFQFNCYSKLKVKYDIKINFELVNVKRDSSIKFEAKLVCAQFIIGKFYPLEDLKKDGFIQENGDLIIKYSINLNGKNNYIYDIDNYYEKFLVKNTIPKLSELSKSSENYIHLISDQQNSDVKEIILLGRKRRIFKNSLKLKIKL